MGARRAVLPAVAALAIAGTWLLLRPGDAPRAGRAGGPATASAPRRAPDAGGATATSGGETARPRTSGAEGALSDLARAVAAGDADAARAAAAALRRFLRLHPGERGAAAASLLDPATAADLRRALALVLGTFGGAENDGALLAAMERFADDPAFLRCALLALGGTREPEEDDDVFDLGDRPFGAAGPAGLGITVRREIGDPAVRAAMEIHLDAGDPALRAAAAAALRHTLAAPDVRDAFLGRLAREPADEVAEVLGESLAGRAGRTADAAESRAILGSLLARAGEEGLDGYRFRMEDDLQRVPLDADARAALTALAAPDRPFAVRSFALTALAGAAAVAPETAAPTRALLVEALAADADPALRDLAARLLHRLPGDEETVAALAKALRGDAAWQVRFAALETLAGWGGTPGVAGALEAALSDPDARVAGRARALRARPPPK